jgi:thiosulfate dehydrogenase
MKKFLLGLVVGVCLVPAFVFLYIRLGLVPVATSADPLPFEVRLAHMALNAKLAKDAPQQSPMPVSDANLAEGAKVYRAQCSVCHGLIGQPKTAIAKGMFPGPPQLFEGKGVTDDPAGETYWKAAYGVRLTGMPSFMGSVTEDQLWQVSLLLANADKLPASVKTSLSQP